MLSVSKQGIATLIFVALGCVTFTKDLRAHISVSCNPARNKIKLIWGFPCANHPENGQEEVQTKGSGQNPPEDVCLDSDPNNPNFIFQQDPPSTENFVYGNGCCRGGEATYNYHAFGCSRAGGGGPALGSQTVAGQGSASVGIPGTADSTMGLHVERIQTPGPAPDLVTVTLVGGGLQTHVPTGAHANVALKLIVYPDQASADADSVLLSGAGSAFFGQATLVGESGSLLADQGFSVADFLLQNDGGGTFTARPIQPFTKTAFVPDAASAIVTVVGDPRSEPESTTGVPGPIVASGVWLGAAFPNPAPLATQIGFGIPHSARVKLTIYDHQGRRVRELVNGNLPAGDHQVLWDGRDTAGRRVPTALYFYRLVVEGQILTGKVFTIH